MPAINSKTELTVSRLPRSSILPSQTVIDKKKMKNQNMYMNLFQTPQQKISSKYLLAIQHKNPADTGPPGTTFKMNHSILHSSPNDRQYF